MSSLLQRSSAEPHYKFGIAGWPTSTTRPYATYHNMLKAFRSLMQKRNSVKPIRRPFFQSKSRAKAILDLIHIDLCVVNVPSHGNYKYVMTVCDDHSKMSFIYLLKLKSEAAKAIENFIIFAQNQKGRTVKAVRSDNGCEYENNHLFNLFAKMGIDHQVTVPHNSQSNGRAERLNST